VSFSGLSQCQTMLNGKGESDKKSAKHVRFASYLGRVTFYH